MRVIGIETTCDETAVAVVANGPDGCAQILSNEILSQIAQHAAFGGVVPEIAARAHIDVLDQLVLRALEKAGTTLDSCDAIAVAAGPGLIGGVIVGLTMAKAMALVAHKPLIAVNHLEAHALSVRMSEPVAFPYLLLLASGGHSQLLAVLGVGEYRRLGTTLDDAIGEAFDKVAKMLGLGYPGGPLVEAQALKGNPERFDLPRPMLGRGKPDFSLSGLKTALRIQAERIAPLTSSDIADLCAGFQAAIVDIIVDRTRMALRSFRDLAEITPRPNALVVAGGVAANNAVRRGLQRLAIEAGLKFCAPPLALCGDNGAMIAFAGLERLGLGLIDDMSAPARARWPLESLTDTTESLPVSNLSVSLPSLSGEGR
jgi:N6-L-threonylcarbamoyladenine synthase